MTLEWMAYAALCAALVGLAAWCVDAVVGAMRRPRRGVWIVAIVASIIVPFALPFRAHRVAAPQASAISELPTTSAGPAAQLPPPSNRAEIVVLSIWAIASAALAMVLFVAHRRTTSALETCRPTTIAGSPAFVSTDFGPAVVGVLRHHVVVPAWTFALSADEQRLVVAHELEHARSNDPMLALAGACAVVVMPWNAALWWQLSRLRLAIELDCDARVVAQTSGDAIAYSQLLISVGERALATRQPVLAMSRSRSALAKRFDALLDAPTPKPRRALALALVAAGIVASVAFVPAPNMSDVVEAIRVRQPVVVAPMNRVVQEPTNRATFTPRVVDRPAVGVVQPRTSRAMTAQPRNRLTAIGDVNALPPVSVVPSTQRGPLDSVVVSSAPLPPTSLRRGGAVIRASATGARGGGAFGTAARPIGGSGGDSVIRGGRGGRATLVARPDTSSMR